MGWAVLWLGSVESIDWAVLRVVWIGQSWRTCSGVCGPFPQGKSSGCEIYRRCRQAAQQSAAATSQSEEGAWSSGASAAGVYLVSSGQNVIVFEVRYKLDSNSN